MPKICPPAIESTLSLAFQAYPLNRSGQIKSHYAAARSYSSLLSSSHHVSAIAQTLFTSSGAFLEALAKLRRFCGELGLISPQNPGHFNCCGGPGLTTLLGSTIGSPRPSHIGTMYVRANPSFSFSPEKKIIASPPIKSSHQGKSTGRGDWFMTTLCSADVPSLGHREE